MVIQYKKYITNTDKIQIFNYKINCKKDKNHRSILPSNEPSISIKHFKLMPQLYSNNPCIFRVCTIVLQLLHNLPMNPNVCFLIIASKLYIL